VTANGAPSPKPESGAQPPIHWTVEGPADAPPIVFVHGAMMGRSVWRPQIDALSERFRCISVDLPGHGAQRAERFTLDRAVDTVVRAIDAEAGGRAVVVGLSLGGYTSTLVAGRHPEKVRALVIAGSTREPIGVNRLAFQFYGWFLRLTPERAVSRVALAWFRQRYGKEKGTAITAGGHFAKGGGNAVLGLAKGAYREPLKAYGGPILVINGELDLVFRIGQDRFLEGVDKVTRRMIRRAGHLSNVDQPEAFTHLVEEFIGSLEA
jgi:pimeloyl-ACP methyl ester carboxylesterase